ncbi:MAG: undecaprenyl/decaprenyl-phosphate alpha-N-acetylglucosaminyl 1-phosphate transferase [Desulfobacteraceae bacterium]|uniref:Undecaprenyl/decaprenyl-phosphate alpha-N-acetylglucosaminyl 1-phosphate transferase n=1 Tax=Candidatus Desulfacyla euxinica TaxID=2841693 RepID=A0A8J6N222_9DELT|nr:undecaprenyl/decaprenyl-phosphate alpha-N-acetylglucosaminyl 1-phosphate transferase [Candidatus Desulfacyla euxinica]MBL6978765.1 undecaprenyl/decaprenyl-phosphate alpha-N-acetylglucosaminyl 1-phosphate transferase [Desulfobacteraceae bacterium]
MKIRLDLGISPKIYPVGLFLTLLLLIPSIRFLFVNAGYRWAYILGLSFGICFSITPLLRRIAFKWGILDEPGPRKIHGSPTPLLGGGGVFFAFVLGILINGIYSLELMIILLASAIIFIVGIVDDIREIPASIKLLIQLLSAGLVISFGITVTVIPLSLGLIGKIGNIALTMMWIIGITNAMNFLDGMDGASAGVGAIISFFLGILAFLTDQPFFGWISLSMMGGCLGFLPYNFKMKERASIFLGDAGSTFIGFVLGTLAVYGHWWEGDSNPIVSFASPLLIFCVLIADMAYVTAHRILRGEALNFREWLEYVGKDHLHHRLFFVLGGKRKAVFFIYAFAITLGISALVLRHADTLNAVLLLIQAVSIVILGTILERHLRHVIKNNDA